MTSLIVSLIVNAAVFVVPAVTGAASVGYWIYRYIKSRKQR